ncbi:hypothetical protein ACIG47_03210 [Promicromonospora sp. NPDC052451]|uniref:hypothetical protein n=1 Tax=Promicromonospora sp. NPDC052451 TaxID=3364407 RepID=UPI0037CC64E9
MIEIDIPMDLMTVKADGVGQGCMTRSRYSIHEGALLVAGRPGAWSWVRAKAVDGRHVTFSLVSEAEAAKGTRVATDVIRAEWPWPRVKWLRVEEHTLVQADQGTFMWVDHVQFTLDSTLDDGALLSALVSSSLYAHGYAWPYAHGAEVDFDGRPVHGPWLAETLTAEMFTTVAAGDARRTVDTWLDDEMIEPPQSVRTHARVARLLARTLDSGTVYRLDVPEGEEHRSNWVSVGATGFHEFVVIDREQEAMHLVVASDD